VERQPDYEQLCEQYLLGELSEAEQAKVEEAYFADDSLFERFLAVKDDLLDAYSRGDLTGEKLERFEKHYLASKARRQKVEETRYLIQTTTASSLNTITAPIESPELAKTGKLSWSEWFARKFSLQPVLWRVGLVAAMLLLIAAGWIVVRQLQDRGDRRSPEQAQKASTPTPVTGANENKLQPTPAPSINNGSERASSSPAPSPSIKPSNSPPTLPPAQIASLTLLPLSSRDTGSANSLILTTQVQIVRLNFVFGDAAYDSFEASVRTVDGQPVIHRGGLKATSNETGKTVTITLDASLLRRQDYIATLLGRLKNRRSQTIAEYYFRVQHN
jgi:anti-sigma factor RsiW